MSEIISKDISNDEVIFIPLGGSEQFGINFNVYGHNGKWLAIDCGVWFPDHRYPMVDLLLPDPKFLIDKKNDLEAFIITHGHEDHIGALPYIWKHFKCPIYCTKFTANFLKKKFEDISPSCKPNIIIIDSNGSFDLNEFKIHFIPVSHSIPDSVSVIIETNIGKIYHSADWNFDDTPVLGKATDRKRMKEIINDDLIAYVGDSTNAMIKGRSGSESDAKEGLSKLISGLEGKIIITLFASNISRIYSVAKIAQEQGRSICLIGRSLHRMTGCAFECGYLSDVDSFVSEDEAKDIPDDNIIYIVTGSQGESRAALARIARGDHRSVKINKGDHVIYSSRLIPGNERDIYEIQNHLSASGANIITPKSTEYNIHVSGHPYRDEIKELWSIIKPQNVICVHGERLMLDAQSKLATECGITNNIVPVNGSVIKITKDETRIIDHIETGVLAVEPRRIIAVEHKAINQRRKLQFSGVAHISLAVNKSGKVLEKIKITTLGLFDEKVDDIDKYTKSINNEILKHIRSLSDDDLNDNAIYTEQVRIITRRFLNNIFGFKPIVTVHLIRI